MKKIVLLGASLLMVLSASAQWGKRIKGNGNMVTEQRTLDSYDAISVTGWFDVELVSGKEGALTLSGEENLLEHIETKVKNGRLIVKAESGYSLQPSSWKGKGILITIPVEDINSVVFSGSGDVEAKTKLVSDNFEVVLSGSGDINLELESDEVVVTLSGSGDIVLKGSSDKLNVTVSGSGDVKAYELSAREVDATVSGSANIMVTASEFIKARVTGSGDIHYRGNPEKIDSKTLGSGDIRKG
ncbi:MAG: head GIN domain-containing protein [Robiginitalea sp.]|jgi:hypothetical protein